MKIAVIHGNMRQGSTWHSVHEILEALREQEQTDVTEFFLPRDMPHFCNGCFSCIYQGEDKCPHTSQVNPFVAAMTASDLIILASPVYGSDVSGQMKAWIDHLCFMWMSHRPNPGLFHKVGLTVATSAGAGLGHTTKTMRNSLVFWGVKKVHTAKFPVSAMKWSDVQEKKKLRIHRDARRLAVRISKSVKNVHKSSNPLFRSFFFSLMSGMQKKNNWNKLDRNHWEEHGWLTGTKPFWSCMTNSTGKALVLQ